MRVLQRTEDQGVGLRADSRFLSTLARCFTLGVLNSIGYFKLFLFLISSFFKQWSLTFVILSRMSTSTNTHLFCHSTNMYWVPAVCWALFRGLAPEGWKRSTWTGLRSRALSSQILLNLAEPRPFSRESSLYWATSETHRDLLIFPIAHRFTDPGNTGIRQHPCRHMGTPDCHGRTLGCRTILSQQRLTCFPHSTPL